MRKVGLKQRVSRGDILRADPTWGGQSGSPLATPFGRGAQSLKFFLKFLFRLTGRAPSCLSVRVPRLPAFSAGREIGTLVAGVMTRLRLFFVAVAYTLLAVLTAVPAAANEDLAPETQGLDSREAFRTGTRFFDEAEVSGGLYFFRRDRRRYDVDKGRYGTNLNHASVQANADFVSGFAGGWLGFDFGVFGSHDLMNKGARIRFRRVRLARSHEQGSGGSRNGLRAVGRSVAPRLEQAPH